MTNATANPKISVAGLVKSFGGKRVLDGVDLDVMTGESVVVVGGSGAGKTVLIKHMIGLIQPDSGRVVMDGVDLTTASPQAALEVRKRCGMSFQEGALFDSMTVFDNIAFPIRRHRSVGPEVVAARVRDCLALVRLPGVEGRMPAQLSGGMRRRVGFARAIALEPDILLFDEPTTGLDPINTAAIATVIDQLRQELSVTLVTITHDMSLAFRVADRIAMIRRGRIVAAGEPEAFRAWPDPYVQAFLKGEVPEQAEEETV
ncbi:MAG TPA: ATP-binding cassette domain-containing protein [Thermoanaerobaculales bacterium]|nr:ATP-binding cassette domain-containing protein [Thermoanaerobaculales bacterium]HPA80838.1 ATP-binding cassette domain-containing protein [Thermoanaerobaculales bacterium]HQL29869.1 ATP-binding cassette domain-containing protein [Thermoanaerobaculales bacterium]HQN96712.1 ATP-binding cassette domain-containing protein [Thermoanaerobaculales bacterium]HQP44432.1 ATP-binding cassette domain-containing protein [Thermoanaerobaculales bacterium]